MDIDILTNWNNKLSAIMEEWKHLSDREKDELLKMLEQEKTERVKRIKETVLENLKNRVKVKENVEMMWYKWKIVEFYLPEAWKDYNPFKYFVSYGYVDKHEFESNPELEKKSYSMEEVWGLLWAMNRYMQAMGGEIDWWDMDYENDLKFWETGIFGCEAGNCLKYIGWLIDWRYWLKDTDLRSRTELDIRETYCHFTRTSFYDDKARLFLKII